MKLLGQIRRCRAGAVAIEFAIVAPLFFTMLFGIIEASRMFWIKQTLDEVAYSTARCMSIGSSCATLSAQKLYAVNRATGLGVPIRNSMVTASVNVRCKNSTGSNLVTITRPLDSPLNGFLPAMPTSISARACFPKLA